jgi:hypothetical protein
MSRRFLGRRSAAAMGAVLAIAITGVVYAYWTAGGSGTGSATVGTSSDVTVTQSTVLTPMYPGDSAQTLSGTFDNPNSGPVFVTTVTVSIGSVTKAGGAPAGTCDASDFTLANATATVNAEIAAGNGVGSWTGPTIRFNDKAGTNQDACQGATVALSYSIP